MTSNLQTVARGTAVETLFIRIGARARLVHETWIIDTLHWVVVDDEGRVRNQGSGDAQALAELIAPELRGDPDHVVAIIGGEQCLSLQVSVPGRSAGQIRRALPFVIEEFLATDIDHVHIAHGPIRRQLPIDCVAIEQTQLRNWCAAFAAVGITPGTLLSDAEMLPVEADEITLYFDEPRILVRTPQQSFVAEGDTLPLALAGALEQLEDDSTVHVRCINGRLPDLDRAQLDQSAPVPLKWHAEEADATGLLGLVRLWLGPRTGTNILQGDFAPRRRRNPEWQRWRAVAGLAAAWFVVALLAQVGQGLYANHRTAQLDSDIRTAYRTHFPADVRAATRSLDGLRMQLAQHVGGSGGESGFLMLTTALAESLEPGSGTSLRGLSYNDQRFELAVDLTAPDFVALDQLRDRLSATGLAVDISSAEQQEQLVRARLRLRG
jgi:general secretion pathway protein L